MKGPIPGTVDLLVTSLAAAIHSVSRARGAWDDDPSMSESLIRVVEELSRASVDYRGERILPTSFYRPSGAEIPIEGVVVRLACAVVRLLDVGARHQAPLFIWDGLDRQRAHFSPDLFSIMARVLRLKESYPTDAIPMIERLAATWVSRAEFWDVVKEMAKRGVGR